jgi:hypothetical protein
MKDLHHPARDALSTFNPAPAQRETDPPRQRLQAKLLGFSSRSSDQFTIGRTMQIIYSKYNGQIERNLKCSHSIAYGAPPHTPISASRRRAR